MLVGDYPFYLKDYSHYVRQLLGQHRELDHLRVRVQFEHTLVKPGGRDSRGFTEGAVVSSDGGRYLVRIQNHQLLDDSDLVIDYSLANIHNIRSSGQFTSIADKMLYVPPLLFPYSAPPRAKHPLLTMFINPAVPRRARAVKGLIAQGGVWNSLAAAMARLADRRVSSLRTSPAPECQNITGCFGDNLRTLFLDTKILINVHQTDHHHTLEELRLLPALSSGVVIVSEDVPCREMIPYHEYIVWTSYASLAETVERTVKDYDVHFQRIFGPGSDLGGVLDGMKKRTHDDLEAQYIRRRPTGLGGRYA